MKEFLGSSCRLVGHAVPAPYGRPLDGPDAEKFMVECASLKCTSNFNARKQRYQPQLQSQEQLIPPDAYTIPSMPMNPHQDNNYLQPTNDITNISNRNELPPPPSHTGLLMQVDQANYHQQLVDNTPLDTCDNGSANLYTSESTTQYMTGYAQNHQPHEQQATQNMHIVNEGNYSYIITEPQQSNTNNVDSSYQQSYQQEQQQFAPTMTTTVDNSMVVPSATPSSNNNNLLQCDNNPRINYDQAELTPSLNADDIKQKDNEIKALRQKVHHYQRRLAVTNHRYKKLKSQQKGRSHKSRLLEHLKICKKDFEPCVFEIFKRLIKGPNSKHGNRWSNDVKSFAASIYSRSHGAYRLVRKTIDLPSESIVKNFIAAKKISKRVAPKNQANVVEGDESESDDATENDDDDDDSDDIGDDDDTTEAVNPSNGGLNLNDHDDAQAGEYVSNDVRSCNSERSNLTLLQ